MATTFRAVCGIYCDRHSTENAIETLKASGFRGTDICALFPDQLSTKKFVPKKQTKLLNGMAVGAGTGALVCGALGWSGQIGISAAAGAMVTTLVGLGAGGVVGSLIGGLAGMRIPKSDEHYEGRVRRGDVLLAVHCNSEEWAKKAAEILKRTRATDVSSRSDFAVVVVESRRAPSRPSVEKTVPPTDQPLTAARSEVRKTAA
jgi:hypothetical protein